jgi:hypothetical protein
MSRTIQGTESSAIVTKLSRLKAHMAAGATIEALRMAAKFGQLGAHKERITRAWAAHTNRETYAAMGHDPDALIADGIAAIRERYGIAEEPAGGE